MVFTVRIEGGTFLGVRESGAYIVFYRSDWVLAKSTPLAATLASDSTWVIEHIRIYPLPPTTLRVRRGYPGSRL